MSEFGNHPSIWSSPEIPGDQLPGFVLQAATPVGNFIDRFQAVVVEAPYVPTVELISTVASGFDRHCAAEFEQLAPRRLIALARFEFPDDAVLVAMAASALALSTADRAHVVAFLLSLLAHPRPFVREAALQGLSPFLEAEAAARVVIDRMARGDPSPGVREAARAVLELW